MKFKQLKLQALILSVHLKRNLRWVFSVVVVLAVLFFIQWKLNIISVQNSIRIGLIGTYQEHDLPFDVTRLLSQGLVKADKNYKIKPNLVIGWEVNNDATQFKFKLRDNLKWVDGSQVKASDLEFSIPNTDVSYPDEHSIQFQLKQSYSPLPSLLVKPVFKKGSLVGIGPYRISKIEKSRIFITKIILKPTDPNLPDIIVRFYPNEKVAVTGFELGEVQAILGIGNTKILTQNPIVALKQNTDFSKIVTLLFNMADPNLKNRSFRQALAFQAPQITGEELADNPYPQSSWAYDNESKKYLANGEEAKAALERAKSSIPDDKLYGELILTTTPNLEDVGKMITASWKSFGFDAKLRVESGIPQNFQTLLITQSIPVDPDQYFLWHATQTKTNLSKYDSKRVDKDLEDGRKIIAEEDRKSKYFDFQKTLLEDAPAVFLYFPKYNIVYLKKAELLLNKILEHSN